MEVALSSAPETDDLQVLPAGVLGRPHPRTGGGALVLPGDGASSRPTGICPYPKFHPVPRMKEAEGEGQGDGSHAVPWRAMLTLAEVERFSARGCGQGGITPSARSRGTGLPAATFHVCPTFLLLAPSSWECLRLSIPKARCMNLSVGR